MKIKHGFEGERFIIIPYQYVSSMPKNPLCGDLYVQSLGHFSNARHHYINRPGGRNEYILIYCKAGRGWVTVGDERFAIAENQVVVIPAGVPHSYGADEAHPWSIYWLHFLGAKAGIYAAGFRRPVEIAPSDTSRIKERLNLFEEMYAALHAGFTEENICYANLCLVHFLGSLLFLDQYRSSRRVYEYSSTRINAVIYYMHENIGEKLTIKEFADYIGYSESYFYRIFIRETGCAPIEYFNRLKVGCACEYLLHSDMSVVQIAHILGFTDPYYFSRTFSRIMGLSPVKYRNAESDSGHSFEIYPNRVGAEPVDS